MDLATLGIDAPVQQSGDIFNRPEQSIAKLDWPNAEAMSSKAVVFAESLTNAIGCSCELSGLNVIPAVCD